MASEPKTAEEIGEQAQAWIEASFSDPHGKSYWQNRYSDDNMETAYCAGFSAGLEHARKVFMSEPEVRFEQQAADGELLDQAVAFAEMWGTEENWQHVRDGYVAAILRDRANSSDPICHQCATQEHGSHPLPENCICGTARTS